jgi:anaerobic magnesium-protoporphyrin IX monomethyl ester cyclase
MQKKVVAFVAFEEFCNLGVGYIRAVLEKAGFKTLFIDLGSDKEATVSLLKYVRPVMVGFSVILQFHIQKFSELTRFLRENGIECHFTAGGHYASLKPEELFNLIPDLDSIVRFEGENITLDLADRLAKGKNWNDIEGIAYVDKNKIILTPMRDQVKKLDEFPFPVRPALKYYTFDRKYSSLIASRGCSHNCAFCNIQKFFRHQGWSVKRVRRPDMVVSEIKYMFNRLNCSVFLFEDDDFPVNYKKEPYWINNFCNELRKKKLDGEILWKINCRPDEIEEKKFELMRKNGLFLVYLGIEDGSNEGLKYMNKHLTVSQILNGIRILKKLHIGFDFGFILFHPNSTFISVDESINFLKSICGDGYAVANFARMEPFYETKIEYTLIEEGRLKGDPGFRTYDFIEDPMNRFYAFITDIFRLWLYSADGLMNMSKWARNNILVCQRFICSGKESDYIANNIMTIISRSNLYLLNTIQDLIPIFESERDIKLEKELVKIKRSVHLKHNRLKTEIKRSVKELLLLSFETQPNLLNYLVQF